MYMTQPRTHSAFALVFMIGIFTMSGTKNSLMAQTVGNWKVHDEARPMAPVVTPGQPGEPVPAPSDAVVLFDGTDLQGWESIKGGPAKWKVENGYMEVVKGTGNIQTKQGFGDCQLHVEWATPAVIEGKGQGRGNSGVFLMSIYEVQVLDSYQNPTYADGQAAAIYGQYPPLVNACQPPGKWQTYDIVFRAPRFGDDGSLQSPAYLTVFHNNILVHHSVKLTGPTAHKERPDYEKHAATLPLMLQDHNNPVRFRNIWIREL